MQALQPRLLGWLFDFPHLPALSGIEHTPIDLDCYPRGRRLVDFGANPREYSDFTNLGTAIFLINEAADCDQTSPSPVLLCAHVTRESYPSSQPRPSSDFTRARQFRRVAKTVYDALDG
jgi:hypothetical protein